MSSANPISLARAFTTRRSKRDAIALPTREGSVRYAPGTIQRSLISMPTELLSTTNVHALNAPDIRTVSTSSSASSLGSNEDSEFSHIDRSFLDTPMTSPETSSMESSPISPEPTSQPAIFVEPKSPKRALTTSTHTARSTNSSTSSLSSDTPAIPKRALSHSKRAHQEIARQRSISRLSPPPTSLPSSVVTTRSSVDIFSGGVEANHPFGRELAQVNEVAEEFRGVSAILDEEERDLRSRGFEKFGVEDYINEIQGLLGGVFEGRLAGPTAWI